MQVVSFLYKAAKSYTVGQNRRLKEQYDMYLAYDEYIEERRVNKRSALSFPLIFAHIEARVATLQEILNTSENIIRFEPIIPGDPQAEVAAERLEAGFQNIRADLEWDEKFTEMFQANEVFDYNWISLEAQSLPLRPGTGVSISPELLGTDKIYPSFELYAPGRVLVDGSYEREHQIPAKFKMMWMTYQQLKLAFPDRISSSLLNQQKSKGEAEGDGLFSPGDWDKRADGTSMATIYDELAGDGGTEENNVGFVVAEAHVKAVYSDGSVHERILTFLPDVTNVDGGSPNGFPLEEGPKPFTDVDNMVFMTRGRPLPYSPKGKGTSDLLVPFQRDFSEQVSTERDFDRLMQAPPLAMKSKMYIGKEKPTMNPYEIWNFKDTPESMNVPVSHFVSQIQQNTPNRQWAMATNTKIQNLMTFISAAVESETGGMDVNPNKTATAFSGRARAANRRIMIPFHQQARSITRIVRAMLAMMGEAPSQFLYPAILANSNRAGPGILTPQDIMASVHVRIPSLAQYANREMQKIMWRMVAEGAAQLPVVAASPSAQLMLVENMLRSMEIGEVKVQEFKARVASDIGLANDLAQSFHALNVIEGGKQQGVGGSGGGVGPAQVAKTANLTTLGVG